MRHYIGANLSRLRNDRGLTRSALAAKAGVTRVVVERIERYEVLPRMQTLLDLAQALGAPHHDLVCRVRPLHRVRFRTEARRRGRDQILAEVSQWLDAYLMLEDALQERLPFRFEAARPRGAPDPAVVARAAREAAGLLPDTPIVDLCRLMEENGVKVLALEKRRDWFFGLSVGPADGGPAIVANTWDRIGIERRIFTVARELGHLLLHPDEYRAAVEDHPVSSEREADAFADEFLMPEAAFAPFWDAASGFPLVDRVLRVERAFRVGYRAVLRRVVATGLEAPGAWAAFHRQYRDRYGRRIEEADEPPALTESARPRAWRGAEEPAALTASDLLVTQLPQLVRRALDRDEISFGRGAEILGIRLVPMREMARNWFA